MAEGPELDDLLERMSWLIAAPAASTPPDPSVVGPGMGVPETRYATSGVAAEVARSLHASGLAVDITAAPRAVQPFDVRHAIVLPLNADGEFAPTVFDCDGCMCPFGSPPCLHCTDHFTEDLYLICDAEPPDWSPSFGRTDP